MFSGTFLAHAETGAVFVLEVAAWSLPAALAAVLARRSPPGCRITWALLAAACAAIALDKAIDIHQWVHDAGQFLVRLVDKQYRFRGPTAGYRLLLLGGLFLVACTSLWLVIRRDRALGPAKLLGLSGIVMAMAYLAARLVPAMTGVFAGWRAWAVEGACYAMVLGGAVLGLRKGHAGGPVLEHGDPVR